MFPLDKSKTAQDALTKYLIQAAIDTVFYVGQGRVIRRDLFESHHIEEEHARVLCDKVSVEVADRIKALLTAKE